MRNELNFKDILRYFNTELTEEKNIEVRKIIDENFVYQKILEGLVSLKEASSFSPESILMKEKVNFLKSISLY